MYDSASSGISAVALTTVWPLRICPEVYVPKSWSMRM